MAISKALHLMQKPCYKLGKAKPGGVYSASFKATKASYSQWPKCQGTTYHNKVDKAEAVFANYCMKWLL